MSEHEHNQASGEPGRVLRHDEWESLLADALDGTLSAADAAAFSRHQSECAPCGQILKETQQGKSWMEYLAVEPEVPADLLHKILTRTSDRPQAGNPGVPAPPLLLPARPAWRRVLLPAVRHSLEPRLMMTAAMAFFSIALTLNLAGIKLTQLRPADFQPSRLRANLTRQYYSTNEQVTKYYENLRLVYEMEARVRELKRSTEAEPVSQPTPQKPARDGSGSPSSTVPQWEQNPPAPGGKRDHEVILPAVMVPAGLDRGEKKRRFEVFRALQTTTEDQAQRSLV
jgi:Putative zinc-finger